MRQDKTEFEMLEMVSERGKEQSLESSVSTSASSSGSFSVAYNEMADVPVQIIDPVEQVQKNLAHLQEVQARMKYMMREIRYLMKI